MRLLHTSDWHVGRTFHGQNLLADQESVLTAIADLVRLRDVDVVVIAGDIYDRAVPSADAVQVATRALDRIRQAGATIVASSGNHDSAPRLGAFSEFLAAGGLHLRTTVADLARPIELSDKHGPVLFYPIPYLEPELVRRELGLIGPAGHQAVLGAAMAVIRADLATRGSGIRSVVAAHAFVVGAVPGGSERSIAVGGVESVTADIFEGVDYVALGHLHGAQQIAPGRNYSGSPLAYSFGEAAHRKSVTLVELDGAGFVSARTLALEAPRPLAVIRGDLSTIMTGYEKLRGHYLSVVLTDRVRPADPMRVLRERFPFALTLAWDCAVPQTGFEPTVKHGDHSDAAVFEAFLIDCRGAGPTSAEVDLIDQALAAQRVEVLQG